MITVLVLREQQSREMLHDSSLRCIYIYIYKIIKTRRFKKSEISVLAFSNNIKKEYISYAR